MEEINVNKIPFNKYIIDSSFGTESVRFINNDEILKIIKNKYLTKDRGQIIRLLSDFCYDGIVEPKYGITERKQIIGYSMNYLKGYIDLEKELLKQELSFEDRKELMIRLSKIFDYFDKMNFAYQDLHTNNIMYKDGDIKLVDLDGGVIKGYTNGYDYNVTIRSSKKRLARFTLSTILGVNEIGLLSLKNHRNKKIFERMLQTFPYEIKNLFEYALNEDYHYYDKDITSTLEDISKDIYEDTDALIEKKLRIY